MSAEFTVVITGTDGSGKSTLAKKLLSALPEDWSKVSIWDSFDRLGETIPRRALQPYVHSLSAGARLSLFLHAIEEAEARATTGQRVWEGHWYKYVASEVARGLPLESALARVAHLRRPDLIFWLDADPADLVARKPEPTLYERGGAEAADAFVPFQSRMRDVLATLAEGDERDGRTAWVKLSALDSPEALVRRALDETIRCRSSF